MDDKRLVRVSKYLSRHLRHEPERLGLTLAPGGWVRVDDLLRACAARSFALTAPELQEVVERNDKRRFSFDGSGSWIRANQGHSVELDLGLALEILNRELGLERLLLEGGGGSNGSFLRAGLIDEISLAICPAVDGAKGAPSLFDSGDREADIAAPIRAMTLTSCEVLEGGAVWLRYRLRNG